MAETCGKNTRVLKGSLFAGAIYFFAVSVVHLLRIKVPGLFIYFDVPSYDYQDRIISFLALGWAAWLFASAVDPSRFRTMIKAVLAAGGFGVAALGLINATTDFAAVSPDAPIGAYWVENAVLFLYWLWLVVFFLRSRAGR
jgi:hypothetical protein